MPTLDETTGNGQKSSMKKLSRKVFEDDYGEADPLADSVERLSILGGELTSPVIKKRRSVTFDKSCLPAEVEIDKITSAVMYHNGWEMEMKRARQKPGQRGYQILMPDDDSNSGQNHPVNMEQPFKIVLEQGDANSYTFTGSENSTEHKGGTSANEIVSLSPIKPEQMMRLRMDMLLDGTQTHLVAFVLSAGKSPSSTALMRLQGMTDEPLESHRHNNSFLTASGVVYLILILLLGVCLKPPVDNLYGRYKLSRNVRLVEVCKDLVKGSETVKREFGVPIFDEGSLFDYHVEYLTAHRASWMMTFTANKAKRGPTATREWELEGTLTSSGDDEIPVTFETDFLFGEMNVEAYTIFEHGTTTWHVASINIDFYRTSKDYTDTMREWVIDWVMASIGAPSYISIQLDEPQHLRVSLEIGHDGDNDGDGDSGANNIIQEKSQLIEGHRVVGYIRPDDDHKTAGEKEV